MKGWMLVLAWAVCVLIGAVVGYMIGYFIWKLGFELIGSAIALVGGGLGGILAFFGFLNWAQDRELRRGSSR